MQSKIQNIENCSDVRVVHKRIKYEIEYDERYQNSKKKNKKKSEIKQSESSWKPWSFAKMFTKLNLKRLKISKKRKLNIRIEWMKFFEWMNFFDWIKIKDNFF